MKKRVLLVACFFQLLVYGSSFSQIPVGDGADPCTWDWEDQRPENWLRSDGKPLFRGGGGMEICPPFAKTPNGLSYCADGNGLLAQIRETRDYKKAQGWYLFQYSFGPNIDWPYFILYNKYRAILRIFYFIGNSVENSSYASASLRFSSLSPAPPLAILSSAVPYKFASDKYFARDKNIVNDLIAQSIPDGAIQNHWNAVDFAIMFDPNYGDKQYKGAKMYIKVEAVDESKIVLDGRSASDPTILEGDRFVFSGKGNENTKDLNILKEGAVTLKNAAEYSKSISEELDSIKPKDQEFLQRFKRDMIAANVPEFLATLSTISSVASGLFSAANFLNGLFGSGAAPPVINYQVLKFTGSITKQKPMIGFDVKVPGVLPSGLDEKKAAFDCPLGLINLSKTPNINATTPYYVYCINLPDFDKKYLGRYVQYNLDTDIEISINDIRDENGVQEMSLQDLKFAIICEAQKDNKEKYYYDITTPPNCTSIPTPDRVYNDLMKGKFIIHKFNPDKQIPERAEVYFGTPFVDPEYFRGVTFEVPEKTDVYLGVSALFKVKGYEQPVVFHAKYKFDPIIVPAVKKEVYYIVEEQTTFPSSKYYNFDKPLIVLDKPLASGTYTTGTILLEPGFISEPGFLATAASAYKRLGEKKIEWKTYPSCKTCK